MIFVHRAGNFACCDERQWKRTSAIPMLRFTSSNKLGRFVVERKLQPFSEVSSNA